MKIDRVDSPIIRDRHVPTDRAGLRMHNGTVAQAKDGTGRDVLNNIHIASQAL